jgi:hypothetical protein
MNETAQSVEISVDLINKIANYLGSRPFNEVAELILNLQGEIQVYSNKIKEEPKKTSEGHKK